MMEPMEMMVRHVIRLTSLRLCGARSSESLHAITEPLTVSASSLETRTMSLQTVTQDHLSPPRCYSSRVMIVLFTVSLTETI